MAFNVLVPLFYYVFMDTVYGNLNSIGLQPGCNAQVRVPVFGPLAALSATATAIPWVVSIYLGIWILVSITMFLKSTHVLIMPEFAISRFLVGLDARRFATGLNAGMAGFSELMQMNYMDNTMFQLAASIFGRLYFIAGLEALLRDNVSEGHSRGRGDITFLQAAAVSLATLALFIGLNTRQTAIIEVPVEDDSHSLNSEDASRNVSGSEDSGRFRSSGSEAHMRAVTQAAYGRAVQIFESPLAALKVQQQQKRLSEGLRSHAQREQSRAHMTLSPRHHCISLILLN